MTPAERKRLLVTLCEGDRTELYIHRLRQQESQVPYMGYLKQALPWLGLLPRLLSFLQSRSRGSSLLVPLCQLALGFFNRHR